MALKVAVVIPGQLSTSPRLLKMADACAEAGYDVRVVSGSFMAWAAAQDAAVAAARAWRWEPVEYRRDVNRAVHAASGARRRLAVATLRALGVDRAPWTAVTRAFSRIYDELRAAVLREPFDLVIGGSVGGLALVADLGATRGVPTLLDLEDLHLDESEAPDAALQHATSRRILERVLRDVTAVTTSSVHIADAYARELGVRPAVVHNVFPFPADLPSSGPRGPLRLYWFSQTIGPGRGIEDAIAGVAASRVQAMLTLRGRADASYLDTLAAAAERVPSLTLQIEAPASPDSMVALCAEHDIGLSPEVPSVANRRCCLSNKAFTYLPAGLPVIFTDTPAQRWLAEQLGPACP
jgi:hypothetical protein